jgi:pantetheine-phosphate adenylyltransferase, bacterial
MDMEKNIIAIYPGSFDPLTCGHEDLIQRASALWPKVIVAVAAGHHKKTLFTLEERVSMARTVLAGYDNVEVHSFAGLLKNAVQEHQATLIVRGVRAVSDFDYEFQMAGMNKHLMPHIETVFLVPGEQHHFTSGTFVREIGLLGGDVTGLVSPHVAEQLYKKREKNSE